MTTELSALSAEKNSWCNKDAALYIAKQQDEIKTLKIILCDHEWIIKERQERFEKKQKECGIYKFILYFLALIVAILVGFH